MKKELNAFIESCNEVLGEIDWYEKNGQSEKLKKEGIPEFKNRLEEYIKMAEEMKKENFMKKHGVYKGEIFNLKECQAIKQELIQRETDLKKSYENILDPNEFSKTIGKFEELLNSQSSKVDKTFNFLTSGKEINNYDSYYKETIATLNDFNKKLIGLKVFLMLLKKFQ